MSLPGPAKLSRTNRPPSAVSKSMPGASATPVRASRSWAERHRVVGEVADVGVHVERPVRRRELGDPQPRQPVEEQATVRGVARDVAVELGVRRVVERREAGALGDHGRADREVAAEDLGGAAQPLGDEHPADPPAGHREVLGEAREDHGLAAGLPGAAGQRRVAVERGVLDAVVDLVGDQLDAVLLAPRGQRRELRREQHGAGRVGRAGDDEPLEVGDPGDLLDRRLEPGLRAGRELDHLAAERGEDVAVAGVARAAPSRRGRRPRTPRGTRAGSRRWSRSSR